MAVDDSGVLSGKNLTQITVGGEHTCALDAAGTAYCWGENEEDGDLGDGTTTNSDVPVAVDSSGVLAGKNLTQITTGQQATCAVDDTGAAYCWGSGGGELGDGSAAGSDVPVAVDESGVLAGKILTQITVGGNYTCALDGTGAAYCWGENNNGQLGDGSTANSSVPVAVNVNGVLAGKTLTQITAGFGGSTCALDSTGAAYCWGYNYYGELGDDNADAGSDVPVLAGPQAPANFNAVPGDNSATVSWTATASLDGGTLTGYTATASPGGAVCRTTNAATCTITGLASGTTYSVSVVAHTTVGDSGASMPATVTPVGGLAFTSGSADTAGFGVAFTFRVTTTGSPAPKITRTCRLPWGVRFVDDGDGTAMISGTPTKAVAGVYPLTLTARTRTGPPPRRSR